MLSASSTRWSDGLRAGAQRELAQDLGAETVNRADASAVHLVGVAPRPTSRSASRSFVLSSAAALFVNVMAATSESSIGDAHTCAADRNAEQVEDLA